MACGRGSHRLHERRNGFRRTADSRRVVPVDRDVFRPRIPAGGAASPSFDSRSTVRSVFVRRPWHRGDNGWAGKPPSSTQPVVAWRWKREFDRSRRPSRAAHPAGLPTRGDEQTDPPSGIATFCAIRPHGYSLNPLASAIRSIFSTGSSLRPHDRQPPLARFPVAQRTRTPSPPARRPRIPGGPQT